MTNDRVSFPPFLLDPASGRLLRDGTDVHLRPRTWDVLCYLARRPGRLVTKDELLSAVWSDAVVSEGTLSNSIRELRVALDDDAHAPRYVETVHRRGFRFVGKPETSPPPTDDEPAAAAPTPADRASFATRHEAPSRAVAMVGRDAELDALLAIANEARGRATRVVLVGGEAGIGKSTLLERFTARGTGDGGPDAFRVAVGRAVGYPQGAPPYLPVLSAVEVLATGRDAATVLSAMRAHVPDVLRQMPWLSIDDRSSTPLVEPDERRDLGVRLADCFTEIASEAPLVLVLEDLHDADAPTVDFVVSFLERSARVPLMIVATYRPGEAVLAGNGLPKAAQMVRTSNIGREIQLELLGPDDVRDYLRQRSPSLFSDETWRDVHRQSGGNPLFMVTVADTMELTGGGAADAAPRVPDSLRGLLEAQLRTLDYREREILMAAAVAGAEFSSLAAAAAAGVAVEAVEDACETLVRQSRFLRPLGVSDWPSGSIGQSYAFRHQLYRGVLYETVPAPRRRVMHQRIGEALESGHPGATSRSRPSSPTTSRAAAIGTAPSRTFARRPNSRAAVSRIASRSTSSIARSRWSPSCPMPACATRWPSASRPIAPPRPVRCTVTGPRSRGSPPRRSRRSASGCRRASSGSSRCSSCSDTGSCDPKSSPPRASPSA